MKEDLKTNKVPKFNLKRLNVSHFILSLLLIVIVNIIGYFCFFRVDLTAEKRYSLSKSTKNILKELDDVVYFKVYLKGDYPASFKRLAKETRELLDEYRAYSDNIQYEFIDPSEGRDDSEMRAIYNELARKGLQPTQLQDRKVDGVKTQVIFPGALVAYKQREFPLQLLSSNINIPPDEIMNISIQNLEYNITSVINKLSRKNKPSIGFVEGHGELDLLEVADITRELQEFYLVERVELDGKVNALRHFEYDSINGNVVTWNKFDLLIIAKPSKPFSEKNKFIIDQHVMRGGSILWLVDPVFASMDSLQGAAETIGIINDLNLDDMFFRYGVRMNTNLLQDMNALPIPIITGKMGNLPNQQFIPWFYFPIITPILDHPIVKNVNAIKSEFISSIDTVGSMPLKKEILLTSSMYTKIVQAPIIINLNILKTKPDDREFAYRYLPVSVLVEGEFKSLFEGRVSAEFDTSSMIQYVSHGKPAKMIFVADGDIIKNQVDQQGPLPLGYDRYSKLTFGNKEFLLNAINYLLGDEDLMQVRAREIKLRLLDKTKLSKNKTYWQVFNIVMPLLVIFILALAMLYYRKYKYSR
ncbi:MAG: gliding motility-associated ABC transporter substrate-binding protein GldG [Bacteroidales bacterium]|nr:gliding motility-associated ABC transporter substrate-binding protein GldG [Bacteroidales bacterium]